MSKRILSIDKILYEIFTESPGRDFRLSELRAEYSERSTERELPANKELFWQIYMQIEALKMLNLIRKEERSSGVGTLLLEQQFWDYSFNIVEGLLPERARH
jgi:hypothetical protein